MPTVQDLLDDLTAGRATLDAVAADFATRTWPAKKEATAAQAWGVADDDSPDPNSWAAVDACSMLTTAQYTALAKARNKTPA